MSDNNILNIQNKCWDFLISLQKDNPNFYFAPRQRNNYKRLDKGYHFIGNDEYMQISFWYGYDNNEKIHNISWTVLEGGSSYIEISSMDNAQKASYLEELIGILERETGKQYREIKHSKWQSNYPQGLYFKESLQDFINTEKLIIDEYIAKHSECKIKMLNAQYNEKYVLNRFKKEENLIFTNNFGKKYEGSSHISQTEYIMFFKHNILQNKIRKQGDGSFAS